ncbi:MAG TPA: ABC transporter permease [Vicinamibacterales bacterium]|nr:ABC transporter permease [Vicinamibacterales bacterium]
MFRLLAVSGQIAWQALGRNRLRTGLTTLGVVIGVAAVIAMVALGNGARASVERTLKSAGTSIVQVSAGNFIRGGESVNIASGLGSATTLTRADADAIRGLADVVHVAAGLRSRTFVEASPEARVFTLVQGTEESLAEIHGWTWLAGRGFTAEDVANAQAKVVLGRVASARLFGEGSDPEGKRVTIHGRAFEVVGMMRAVDKDQDEGAFVPVTTLGQLTSRSNFLQTITVGVTEAGVATSVGEAISALLRARHAPAIAGDKRLSDLAAARAAAALGGLQGPSGQGGGPDDFVVRTLAAQQVTKGLYTEVAAFALANMPKLDSATMEEMSGTLNRAGTTMTALLASIAAISLVVGGIGIMNIMLVSVTERTREIGLRLAMGARRKDVLVQFLTEAVVLSLLGGLVGIGAGILAARGLTALLSWPTEVSPQAILLAFAISAIIGVAFGYYPARRASLLDPIVALRRE